MKNFLLTMVALLIAIPLALAQRTITGKVVAAETNETLIGANILIKGTSKGATSNAEGNFTLTLSDANVTDLVVSYIGYTTQEVSIKGQTNITIALVAGKELNEVVVVGYTSSRKQDLTGAVAVVDLKPIKNISSGNPMQALQGRVAGLYIEKDGSPNGSNSRILIRGANTLGNNDPLYVIDGIPTTRPEVFQNMNPANIENIQVLKDASAESIYGSRASNGVIIVTTKMVEIPMEKLNFSSIAVSLYSLKKP